MVQPATVTRPYGATRSLVFVDRVVDVRQAVRRRRARQRPRDGWTRDSSDVGTPRCTTLLEVSRPFPIGRLKPESRANRISAPAGRRSAWWRARRSSAQMYLRGGVTAKTAAAAGARRLGGATLAERLPTPEEQPVAPAAVHRIEPPPNLLRSTGKTLRRRAPRVGDVGCASRIGTTTGSAELG